MWVAEIGGLALELKVRRSGSHRLRLAYLATPGRLDLRSIADCLHGHAYRRQSASAAIVDTRRLSTASKMAGLGVVAAPRAIYFVGTNIQATAVKKVAQLST